MSASGLQTLKRLLHVNSTSSNVYIQFPVNVTTLASADCDTVIEAGRMIYDDTTDTLFVCGGATGWRKVTTSAA